MVVTTQSGKAFLANINTRCGYQIDPHAKPVYKHTWRGGPHPMSIEWIRKYSERNDGAQQVVRCGGSEVARYDTDKRAAEVVQDYNSALNSGKIEFVFPQK